jgi:hypothetical protein
VNNREQQEITTLALQLLQNCLMLINTLLVERTLEQPQLLPQLTDAHRRALAPLYYEHVNPYGIFALNLDQPLSLDLYVPARHRKIVDRFEKVFFKKFDRRKILLLTALLFASMIPLHRDVPRRQLAMYLQAYQLFDEYHKASLR